MLKALGRLAVAPGVVGRFLPPVVPGINVSPEFNQHLHQIGVFHLGSVMEGCLVKFGGIHIGPCIEQYLHAVQVLSGAGHMQRCPEMAIVGLQVSTDIDQQSDALGTAIHAGLVEGRCRVERRVHLGPVREQDFHTLDATRGTGVTEGRAAIDVSGIHLGPCGKEDFHALGLATQAGLVQRRDGVVGDQVDAGAVLNELLQLRDFSPPGCFVNRCPLCPKSSSLCRKLNGPGAVGGSEPFRDKAFSGRKKVSGYTKEELEETYVFFLLCNKTEHSLYEFSARGVAEPPWRICPYVTITLQCCELQRMPPLNHKSTAECKTEVLYRAWKGQLFIHEQRLCDVVFQSPFSGSIPAQLPAKLEVRHVVGVSELRKKLPEAAFRKNSYTNHEACYQGILFCLYGVEILNQNELKVDQLLRSLKEKDLALVKHLNDRGVLVLLASSSLVKEKDSDPDEPTFLQALFVISSPRPKCLTADGWKCERGESERSLQVTLVLPGLRHALVEAAKVPDGGASPCSSVKLHIQEFAKLHKDLGPTCGSLDSQPFSFDLFLKKPDLDALSEKCLPTSLSHLQFYLSHPQNYILEMSAAVACLKGGSQSAGSGGVQDADSSSGLNMDSLPPGGTAEVAETTRPRSAAQSKPSNKDAAAKAAPTGDRTVQRCKRKSSRLLGASARKKWSPLKALCIMESNKKRKKTRKKKTNPPPPSSENPEPAVNSSEPTLKLKNLQNPLRRKRGAEVLSAEFVQRTRCESASKATSASEGLGGQGENKPPLLKRKKDTDKVKSEEKRDTRRQITRKSARLNMDDTPLESQQEAGDENDPVGERTATQDACPAPRKEECDSHALNMLADLALSSCNSPLVSNSNKPPLPFSPSRELRRLPRGKPLHKSSDHEYHRATKKCKGASLSSETCQEPLLSPGQSSLSSESPSSSQERGQVSSSKKRSARPGPAKPHVAPPKEAGDLSDSSMPSLISSEHSYASLVSESLKKGAPGSPSSKNGVKNAKSGPLVGKVLPFRHQQSICHPPKQFRNYVPFMRSTVMAARLKDDFSKSHKVAFCDKTVKVTFQWEAEYLFSLDSKYTNCSLEKTVIRAVHGPWDVNRTDDLEEMKLILHMWVALFYSKPFKSPTVRKVVEHSNPAKYVSLNSVVDPVELVDDCEGPYSLEKCPADSLSDANQTPSEVEDRAVSPSEKPLSCNELSSTNCLEDEAPLVNPEEPSDLPPEEEQLHTTARNSEDTVHSLDKVVAGEEPEEEGLPDPVLSIETPDVNSSDEHSTGCSRPWACRTDAVAEAGRAVHVVEASQSDAAAVCAGPPEDSSGKQPAASNQAAVSAGSWEINNATPSAEGKEDTHQIKGVELLHRSEAVWLEANTDGREDDSPCREVRALQDLPTDEEEADGESVEWESIDLTLSESNDADVEPRDVDLDQENEESPGGNCATEEREAASVCDLASSGCDSQFSSIASPATVSVCQAELPDSQEDPVVSAPNCASLTRTDLVEGFSLLEKDRVDSLVDSVPRQDSPVHQMTLDEEAELPRIDNTVVSAKRPISPDQMDVVANPYISQEDKGINLADSASVRASELFQPQNELETAGESAGSQDSPVSVKNPILPNPVDLVDISCVSMENKGINLADAVSGHSSPVHHTAPSEVVEVPRNQEDSAESTRFHVSPNLMDLIEDISQESIHLSDSAPLQTSEECQVQNRLATQGEYSGNQENTVVPAQNLAPAKEMDLTEGSYVPQDEEGIQLADTARLQASPAHQTTSNELLGNPDDDATAAKNAVLLEKTNVAGDPCTPPKKKVIHLPDTALLHANEGHQIQHSAVTQDGLKIRQTAELLNDSQSKQENQSLELDDMEIEANSANKTFCVRGEGTGASSVVDKRNQMEAIVAEDIKSVLYELIDTVSAMALASEQTCVKENPGLNWISSITLECVTPPESDEESCTTAHLAHANPAWMANECLEQHSIFVDQEKATSHGEEEHPLVLHASLRSGQVDMFGRRSLRENEAAMDVLPSPRCTNWAETGTASLECKSPLAQPAASSRGDNSVASTLREVRLGQASHEASVSQGEAQFREACTEILPFVPAEGQIEYSLEEPDSLMQENTRESLGDPENSPQGDTRESLGDAEDAPAGEITTLPTKAAAMNMNWEGESFSVDGDQELVGEPYHKNKPGSSCMRSSASPEATVANYVSDLDLEEDIHKSGDWEYLENKERASGVEAEAMKHDCHFMFKEDDRSVPFSLDTNHEPGLLKDYINFSVTKKHKEKTRTFHSSKRRDIFTGELGFMNSSNRTWRIWNDPIQNTLDMECLRFHYKVKQILKKTQHSTSTDTFTKEFSPQVIALPLRKVPGAPALSPPPRSQSPLLVTIVNPGLRPSASHRYPRSSRYGDSFEPPPPPPPLTSTQDSTSKAARFRNQGQGATAPFHLNKLTYNNKLKDFRGDISVIMDEFADLSTVMTLDNRQTSNKGRDPNTTSEDVPEKRSPSLSGRTASYKHLFDELSSTLHFRLKNVAQEACKKPYAFYLMETDDDPFFGRVKNLLKKGGHTETEPLHFCKASHVETDRLMVIIRNEDIFPHIHKIPSLLRLKHFPSVTFAGVDSPEDVRDHIYQELFHSGGFVVTDDTVLETLTLGELKEMVKTMEKLNGHGRWKWLLHYKENKKLREDARVDPAAHAKESLLQSCQGANITEALHYHQCDSRSCPRDERLHCLLTLQVQRISERFAVFLTGKTSASRDVLENKGILVLDVNTFIATAQETVRPFRSGY